MSPMHAADAYKAVENISFAADDVAPPYADATDAEMRALARRRRRASPF